MTDTDTMLLQCVREVEIELLVPDSLPENVLLSNVTAEMEPDPEQRARCRTGRVALWKHLKSLFGWE